jgi:hypothetical protein
MPVRSAERRFFPLDRQLELSNKKWSKRVAKWVVWLSGLVDFEQVAEFLNEVGQIDISASSTWRLTQRWGERLVALETKEAEQANATVEGPDCLPRRGQAPDRKGLSMDGFLIYLRGEEWKEVKLGCLFEVVPRPMLDPKTGEWMERGHAVHNSYVSHLGGPEDFGQKLWTEAQRRHFRQTFETEVVADAAAWIWNLVGDYFYDSYQLVDWYHGIEHLARAAQLLYGEGTLEAKRWLKEQETVLYQGRAEEVIHTIEAEAEQHATIGEELLSEARYFKNHRHRMNYMEMREEGWVIGSGMVESGGKQFKARFCGAGMRWSREGARHLLPVRNAILSKRFDQRWKSIDYSPKI